jgi:microcystin-dependent protein
MPRTKISEFSATAASNTDVNSIDIAENCSPAGINDSLREMAAMLKKQEVGTDPMTSPVLTTADINGGTYDGGAINSTTIGATTASTGAFTTLSASGTFTLGGAAVTATAAELNVLSGGISTPPTAAIHMYGGTSAPTGWLLCNGAAVSRSTYADLFAIVGTTYGAGDGSSTFNLPDLRDRFAVGSGTTYSAGATGGAATHTLSTAEMPAHTHTATSTDSGHTHNFQTGLTAENQDDVRTTSGSGTTDSTQTGYANITTTIASTGGGGAHNNLPPYIGLAFIIKT